MMAPATAIDFERALTALSFATSGKRPSKDEAKAGLAIYERALADVPARDLERAVTKLVRECTFMPTPAELLKAANHFAAKRSYAISRARHLIWLHERDYRPPVAFIAPEELADLRSAIDEAASRLSANCGM
ncbi:MAG: hypothetical protein KKA12_08550 [Alphaproteobacteria bacterium]|nr:hypothetical protein [Alphaproteobacteria bacterium]